MGFDRKYDVVVAGGGLAGIAAAVCAAREGARTLLIERYGFLGGMGTAGLVNPFMSYFTSDGKPLVGGVFDELCGKMQNLGGMSGRAFDSEIMKFVAQELVLESGAELLFHSFVSGVKMDDQRIVGLQVMTKGGVEEIAAHAIVDATGDADVAAMAGAPYEKGNPDNGLTQAMTMMFNVGGVDLRGVLMRAKEHPDQMRFPKPTDEASVESLLQAPVSIAGFYGEIEEARANGEFPLEQDMVFFLTLTRPGEVVVNTTHVVGVDGTNSEDLTKAEIEGRRQVMTLMTFFRKYIPGFEGSYLMQTGTQIGVRETRRIVGEYLFNADDVLAGAKFADCVLRSAYPVDVHSSAGKGYAKAEDHEPPRVPPAGDWYEVPYRCLIPKGVDNLIVAGRCISATHEGQGAMRIMPNCTALGQAAGTAAALSSSVNVAPRVLDTELLRKRLMEAGAII